MFFRPDIQFRPKVKNRLSVIHCFLYSLGGVTFNKCWITLSILNCYSNFGQCLLLWTSIRWDHCMKFIPKCQNVIESKAVNVGPFFHIVHLLNLKLHVTLSEKRWGFPSVDVCRINYNVTRGRHHNTIGCKFVYQMIVHYEKKFTKLE